MSLITSRWEKFKSEGQEFCSFFFFWRFVNLRKYLCSLPPFSFLPQERITKNSDARKLISVKDIFQKVAVTSNKLTASDRPKEKKIMFSSEYRVSGTFWHLVCICAV